MSVDFEYFARVFNRIVCGAFNIFPEFACLRMRGAPLLFKAVSLSLCNRIVELQISTFATRETKRQIAGLALGAYQVGGKIEAGPDDVIRFVFWNPGLIKLLPLI